MMSMIDHDNCSNMGKIKTVIDRISNIFYGSESKKPKSHLELIRSWYDKKKVTSKHFLSSSIGRVIEPLVGQVKPFKVN